MSSWDGECPECGANNGALVPVWEDPEAHASDDPPDFIGCKGCHTMREVKECVYCDEQILDPPTHHEEEHPMKRYNPGWYINDERN